VFTDALPHARSYINIETGFVGVSQTDAIRLIFKIATEDPLPIGSLNAHTFGTTDDPYIVINDLPKLSRFKKQFPGFYKEN
jgi:hypothetical protein